AAMSRHPASRGRATVTPLFGADGPGGRPAAAVPGPASFAAVVAVLTGPWRVDDPVGFAGAMRAAPLVAGHPVVDLGACTGRPPSGLDPLSAALAAHLETAVAAAAGRPGRPVGGGPGRRRSPRRGRRPGRGRRRGAGAARARSPGRAAGGGGGGRRLLGRGGRRRRAGRRRRRRPIAARPLRGGRPGPDPAPADRPPEPAGRARPGRRGVRPAGVRTGPGGGGPALPAMREPRPA